MSENTPVDPVEPTLHSNANEVTPAAGEPASVTVHDGANVEQTVEIPENAVRAIMQVAAKFHSGPIPDPESFERYEKSLPGAGSRILAMAEKAQEAKIIQAPIDREREFVGRITGQIAGLVSLGLVVGCATYIATSSPSAGAITVAVALVATPLLGHIEKITDFFRKNKS